MRWGAPKQDSPLETGLPPADTTPETAKIECAPAAWRDCARRCAAESAEMLGKSPDTSKRTIPSIRVGII
ncbi:hypothetical protein GCM10028797_01550 [Dyella agri]